jgi:hypothetical protein
MQPAVAINLTNEVRHGAQQSLLVDATYEEIQRAVQRATALVGRQTSAEVTVQIIVVASAPRD